MDKNNWILDPHVHMTSRTTSDYETMRNSGVIAIIEPAFWLGQPRTEAGTFKDYFSSLVGWERFRASQFGIRHYSTIGLNSKEANNEWLAEQVMELLPLFVMKEGVVGIGEIGYDDQTAAEDKYYRLQLDLAKEVNAPVQIHTPHRDKKKGTTRSMDVSDEMGLDPGMVLVDHNNEETIREVLDRGFWAGFSIYPYTKMSSDRMVEVVRQYGAERIMINSAADWGISDPLAVSKTRDLMRKMGIDEESIRKVVYGNALEFFAQSGQISEEDWADGVQIDQSQKYLGNTILRGGQTPKVES